MINLKEQKLGKNVRKSFSRTRFNLELPNLVEVQTKSYKWFLEEGLVEVLKDVSPITDYSGNLSIDFTSFSLSDKPKYPVDECKERDANYAAQLKVTARLSNKITGEIKEEEIYMGEFPLMTDNGTFIINGAERVIVSQIIRSPGMYYESAIDKTGRRTYAATVIPYRGAWLEYETDNTGAMYVHIDKTRKVPLTMLIRALGVANLETNIEGITEYEKELREIALKGFMSSVRGSESTAIETVDEIVEVFGDDKQFVATLEKDECDKLAAANVSTLGVEALKEVYKRLRPGEPPLVESAKTLLDNYFFDARRYDIAPVGRYKFNKKMDIAERISGHVLAENISSAVTGELLFEEGHVVSPEDAKLISRNGVNKVLLKLDNGDVVKVISNNTVFPKDVLGYDLKEAGISEKCDFAVLQKIIEVCEGDKEKIIAMAKEAISVLCPKHITKADIYASINYLINLAHDIGRTDDIDHLGNRRIRSVGEQLQNQLRIGFSRMDKIIKERMTTQDNEKLTPIALINVRPVATVIREFFGSSQLSQFMDQNNPLAELTHKRRLSALGPGGLSRDRASFDVRDVHYTQYGRMCPIETPEGPNIGLISYLTTYAKINNYGFIEAPYRKVEHIKNEDGTVTNRVTDEVEYMTADVEDSYIIAQANEPLDENGYFINKKVTARDRTEILEVSADKVSYMDVSPKMVVSVATAMIPFLENDDNSRALMGSNMQKQAVPLMVTENPIVATGMEYKAAVDSGVVVTAKTAGVVERVEAERIVIVADDGHKEVYNLGKFKRSNQGTCFNQRPIVCRGERVEDGQVIADGPATKNGEISLGKNALIGFMTWEGYNYEDAVLLNERLVRDDVYTSLHIEEYTLEARETKLGSEMITREIPNVGEDMLKDLNAEGIVRKGVEVRAGDILVGKITPKGETELTAEERLLRAIFGEKAREVRDTSLRLPHGESGIVVDIRSYSHEQGDELPSGVIKVVRVYIAQKRKISVGDKMAGRHGNKGVVSRILPPEDMPFLADGTPLDIVLNPLGVPSRMNIGQVLEVHLGIASRKLGWKIMTPVFDGANEKDISECLKMAGYSRNLYANENPEGKDLYEEIVGEDGTKDYRLLTPEERENAEYIEQLRLAGKCKLFDGKQTLYDGRTGEPFDNPVTVGIMYYLKLHHLVDDKIHARSNGPYSLVTQQPLGGKAQFGGQRFGEMEVWALEAYGAAYTLQEILTVKSDDITGRRKAYEAIIKGQNIPTPGIPESFKVLVKELQALALDIKVLDSNGQEIPLEQLGQDDEPSVYSNKIDEEAIKQSFGQEVETEDMGDSYTIVDGEDLDKEDFGGSIVSEDDMYGDSDDSDDNGYDE